MVNVFFISLSIGVLYTIVKVADDYVMQAEVQGQKITWLTPHALQQVLTDDVDFNVMLTFLEFYEVRIW
jgi:pescadillo protein